MGDILSCSLGYIVGTLFAAVDFWWLSVLWIVISEVRLHKTITALAQIEIEMRA